MADRFAKNNVPIVESRKVAQDHYVTTFADAEIAGKTQPGQFFQVRLQGPGAPFLPRPFSIYDWHEDASGVVSGFSVLYKVVGQGTTALAAARPGDTVSVTGPLGNTFTVPQPPVRVFIVAGGIGIAPFLAFARRAIASGVAPSDIELLLGARSLAQVVAVEEFKKLGLPAFIATEDGSEGIKGTTIDLMRERLAAGNGAVPVVYSSGPAPMLDAVAVFCRENGLEGELSLEARMICGIGACNSCAVAMIAPDEPDGWQYKLVCRDGPVFKAKSLYVP